MSTEIFILLLVLGNWIQFSITIWFWLSKGQSRTALEKARNEGAAVAKRMAEREQHTIACWASDINRMKILMNGLMYYADPQTWLTFDNIKSNAIPNEDCPQGVGGERARKAMKDHFEAHKYPPGPEEREDAQI